MSNQHLHGDWGWSLGRIPRILLALVVLIAGLMATGGPAATPAAGATYFGTLPPGSALPGDADCAARIRRSSWEPKPENYGANHSPANHTPQALWSDYDPRAAAAFRNRVNGNFVGTTDELIQFYACKWGLDEDIVRAVAHRESTWSAAMLGDTEWDAAHCAPGYGVPCPTSFGLTQVRWYYYAETFPHSLRSTAFNLDIYLALQRTCFEGWIPWLREPSRWHNGQRYGAGDQWGCVGWWFAGGSWHGTANLDYISRVQSHLSSKPWLTWADGSSTIPYDTRLSGGPSGATPSSSTFPDVPADSPAAGAIRELAARGIIQGYADGRFGPGDTIQRAQMAGLIARSAGWDGEDHGNPFTDRNGLDSGLWRNVGTLAHHGVAQGYGDGTFGPFRPVTRAETLALITRALVVGGHWARPTAAPTATGPHAADLATYLAHVGALPEGSGDLNQPATRGWFALALWAALQTTDLAS